MKLQYWNNQLAVKDAKGNFYPVENVSVCSPGPRTTTKMSFVVPIEVFLEDKTIEKND